MSGASENTPPENITMPRPMIIMMTGAILMTPASQGRLIMTKTSSAYKAYNGWTHSTFWMKTWSEVESQTKPLESF
jgi:hypothetical protein